MPLAEHLARRGDAPRSRRLADHRALPGGEPGGLHHQRPAVPPDVRLRRRQLGEDLDSRRWGSRGAASAPWRTPSSSRSRRPRWWARRRAARGPAKWSTMPSASGHLGAHHGEVHPLASAQPASAWISPRRRRGSGVASAAVPPLPRVTKNSASGASRRSFQRSACSRPPLPTIRIFISPPARSACVEVGDQVLRLLDPQESRTRPVGEPHALAALGGDGGVGHARRVADQALHAARATRRARRSSRPPPARGRAPASPSPRRPCPVKPRIWLRRQLVLGVRGEARVVDALAPSGCASSHSATRWPFSLWARMRRCSVLVPRSTSQQSHGPGHGAGGVLEEAQPLVELLVARAPPSRPPRRSGR